MSKNQPLPCPHQELIKAWADGAIIQYYNRGHGGASWEDVHLNQPTWAPDVKYRVKPTANSFFFLSVAALPLSAHHTQLSVSSLCTNEAAAVAAQHGVRIAENEWVPAGVVHITADPTTGKVLTAEVMK